LNGQLPASQLPTVEGFDGRAIWAAISPGAWNSGFKHGPRICQRSIEHVPGDSGQWDLQSTTPTCAFLSRERTDVDVDKSLASGTLHDGTTEIGWGGSAGAESGGEFKTQVPSRGSLPLGCFVHGASTDLHSVIDTRWRLLQNNSEGEFVLHVCVGSRRTLRPVDSANVYLTMNILDTSPHEAWDWGLGISENLCQSRQLLI
jgi:hypothetical protein